MYPITLSPRGCRGELRRPQVVSVQSNPAHRECVAPFPCHPSESRRPRVGPVRWHWILACARMTVMGYHSSALSRHPSEGWDAPCNQNIANMARCYCTPRQSGAGLQTAVLLYHRAVTLDPRLRALLSGIKPSRHFSALPSSSRNLGEYQAQPDERTLVSGTQGCSAHCWQTPRLWLWIPDIKLL